MAERVRTKAITHFKPGIYVAEDGTKVTRTATDCAEMMQNFAELTARGEYPAVTLGHPPGNDAPKYGEWREAWLDPAGNLINGPLDVHPELAAAIAEGAYDHTSIVFRDHWWDPVEERYRNNVITQVGVLGAKWGACKQADQLTIDRQMSEGGDDVVVYRLSMADMEVAPDEGGGEDVEDKERKGLLGTIEELKAKIVELEAAAVSVTEVAELKAELASANEKLELATKAGDAAAEKIADAEVKAKEDVVDGVLTEAVTADKDGNVKMLPSEAKALKSVMLAMDDSKTIKLAEGKDGGDPVMGSMLDQFCETIRSREPVLKLAEKAVDDSDPLHKGKEKVEEPELNASEREAAAGFGMTPEQYAAARDAGPADAPKAEIEE